MRLIIPKTRTGRAFPAPDGSDADPPFTRRFHPARAERPRPAAAKGPACRPARHRDGPHPRRPARAACAAPPGRAPPALGCSWSPPRAHARHLCCPARSGQTPAPDPRTPLRSQPAPSVHAPKQRETVQSPPTTMRPPPPENSPAGVAFPAPDALSAPATANTGLRIHPTGHSGARYQCPPSPRRETTHSAPADPARRLISRKSPARAWHRPPRRARLPRLIHIRPPPRARPAPPPRGGASRASPPPSTTMRLIIPEDARPGLVLLGPSRLSAAPA